MLFDNDENNHTSLISRQPNVNEDVNTHENIPFLPVGSTVAVQCRDGVSLTHQTIIGHGSDNHQGRSYKIKVTKMEFLITRTNRHIKTTLSQQTNN